MSGAMLSLSQPCDSSLVSAHRSTRLELERRVAADLQFLRTKAPVDPLAGLNLSGA